MPASRFAPPQILALLEAGFAVQALVATILTYMAILLMVAAWSAGRRWRLRWWLQGLTAVVSADVVRFLFFGP